MRKWFSISACVLAIDIYTKHLIQQRWVYGEHRPLTFFLDLVRYHNTGAAFSFLAGASGWQHYLFCLIAMSASALMAYLIYRHPRDTLQCLGLSLILGGALGNLYDRLTLGYVVDFIYFHYLAYDFPAFNVADSAITVGVAVLLLDSFKKPAKM